jgi:nucleotide-binding universal stress UspA family protein
MYNKILIPTHGGNNQKVITNAVEHAEKYDSEIHAVYVLPKAIDKENKESGDEEFHGVSEADGNRTLSEYSLSKIENQVPEEINLVKKELSGTPSSEITKYAHENNIDLVVMGTHGRSGVQRYLMGSVAEKVVRNCNPPVLTVKLE